MLQESGQITIEDIAAEFNLTAPYSFFDLYGIHPSVPTSGEISLFDFYGLSSSKETFITLFEDGAASSSINCICVENSGAIYVCYNGYIIKVSGTGTILWQLHMDVNITIMKIREDGFGNIIVMGNYTALDVTYVAKITTGGVLVWAKHYDASSLTGRIISAMTVDNSGRPIIAGVVSRGSTLYALVAKLGQNGELIWSRKFRCDYLTTLSVVDVVVDYSNAVYVGGNGIDSWTDEYDGFFVKYSSDGTYQSVSSYGAGLGYRLQSLYAHSSNQIFAVGTYGNGTSIVSKHSTSGSLIDTVNIVGPSSLSGYEMAEKSDGTLLVSGRAYTTLEPFIIELSSTPMVLSQYSAPDFVGDYYYPYGQIGVDESDSVYVGISPDIMSETASLPLLFKLGLGEVNNFYWSTASYSVTTTSYLSKVGIGVVSSTHAGVVTDSSVTISTSSIDPIIIEPTGTFPADSVWHKAPRMYIYTYLYYDGKGGSTQYYAFKYLSYYHNFATTSLSTDTLGRYYYETGGYRYTGEDISNGIGYVCRTTSGVEAPTSP